MNAPDSSLSLPIPLEVLESAAPKPERRFGMSLFWRTLLLLAMLLLGSTFTWYQTFKALEYEPRAIQAAQQIASLVNLTRAALLYSDSIQRVSLIKTLAEQEKVRILPREPADKFERFSSSQLDERITAELINRLGPGTVVASSVNGEQGLWVGFTIDGDSYWLLMDPSRLRPLWGAAWTIWLLSAGALSLMGAAMIAGLINAPLKQLSLATTRVREGDFDAPTLDEHAATKEIREVNIGFNRMAEQLAKIELDRTEMLAGISHDLRTPLARLRLEAELSVSDPDAREQMVADIAQLDAIIDKFLDYARPDHVSLSPTSVAEVVESCVFPFRNTAGMDIRVEVSRSLQAMADEVELGRVISNLLENARRYAKSPGTGLTRVNITAQASTHHVHIRVRDFGPGVSPHQLALMTKPFVRGDAARTEAKGAGLGLAIVDKTVKRMGGTLNLSNAQSSGLAALITLPLP